MSTINRRSFLKTSLMGGVAIAYINPIRTFASPGSPGAFSSRVALTTGDNRADLAFRALQPFAKQIKQAIGDKLVILKPNNVNIEIQLASTHVDTLEGALEFLKSINKLKNTVIAESAANGPTFDGFSNFGYNRLADKYQIKLVDLDQDRFDVLYVFDEKDFKPHPVRMSRLMLSPDSYIVSVARMKTHDRVLATLSLKNIVFGAPVKDIGFAYGAARKQGTKIDKPIVHGSGFRGINYNLYALARQLHLHLAIIDGFEGMEGNGPNNGTPVDHRICVASTDWLAADRIGIELMGIDFSKVGYLNYCAQTNLGTADLSQIEIVGERLSDHIKSYKLSKNIESQLVWMNPVTT
ncbi:MAG TPA: DUF362 domain-containing protein [Bacteroidales bacterium]|nr:DUF362 domain-containing protein [Bacteroidales bacterium]